MPRGLLIFAFCVPLAVLMGFMLSDPLMNRNMMFISAAVFSLLIPLALSIHHRALIWAAGAYINAFFLPGQPQIWMVFAALSFGIAVLSRPLSKVKIKPVWDRSVALSLFCLITVVVVTALTRGGVGMRVLGSAMYGGRKYVWLLAAAVGFFALTLGVIQRKNARRDLAVFTLAPITAAVGNLAYILGPAFYVLFLLFPVDMAWNQAQADIDPLLVAVKRYNGLGPASIGVVMYCIMRWGLRGILQMNKPWRVLLVVAALFAGLLSGFRSILAICFILALVQFFAEGLHRTRYAAGAAAFAVVIFLMLAGFSDKLPLATQRALSFLPIKVDATTAYDANTSIEWRLRMWKVVTKRIPDYFWLGKGYAVDPADLYFTNESMKRGYAEGFDWAITAGDYHNGPLSIILPFGIFGVLAFVWFCWASIRVLWRNMRQGDAEIRNINVFLFSLFVSRVVFFTFFFGSLESDLWPLASVVGISLALNGGSKQPPPRQAMKFERRGKLARLEELTPA